MTAPYQVMPPLSPEERAELKADISARGVLVPVEYDEAGRILDGHHRVELCGELGLTSWPRLIRYGMSEDEKRRHARRLNVARRHLTAEQRRSLIADDLREHPGVSDRTIATGLGVDHKTVGAVREEMQSTGEIPQLERRKGRDGRERRIVQFVPSTAGEEKGLSLAARALNERNRRRHRDGARMLAQTLSESSGLSPDGRRFPVVYADPPWRRKAGFGDRAYENHYTTMTWDEIIAMPVAQRVLPDAWLFLWIPRAHLLALHPVEVDTPLGRTRVKLPLAWAVAQGWGFDAYSTCAVWTKTDEAHPDDHGTGLIFWDQDEILCLFRRGRGLPMPPGADKVGSNHREPAGPHSAKPPFYRDMINRMTGGVPVLELFAREDDTTALPPNFFTWGNQSRNTAELPPHDPETGEVIEAADVEPDEPAAPAASPECGCAAVPRAADDENLDIPAFLKRPPPAHVTGDDA